MKLTKDNLLLLYTNMVKTRKVDELMVDLISQGKILSFYHSGQGGEAVPVGVSSFLRKDDYVYCHHRGHGLGTVVAKGSDIESFVAEHCGKVTGSCMGLSGYHHTDPENGIFGYSGLLGSNFVLTTGWGMAAKWDGKQQVVINEFGDGTSGRGTFHEGINMASIWKLPVVYVCHNNGVGQHVPICDVYAKEDIADLAAGYDVPAVVVDGQDVLAVHEAVQAAVERARRGDGPSFIECKTQRFRSHAEGLADIVHYTERTESEVAELKKRDPIVLFRKKLIESGTFTAAEADLIDKDVDAKVQIVAQKVEDAPLTDDVDILEKLVFAQ